ncbi:MAG: (d)CMP kinase [Anaerolineales bacterium]|nr:(d)CMP kinase [Anaerolineales bacterium]
MHYLDTIAIDGPASSGKSTLGEKLAAALNFLFFDTGVMYRAVTLAAMMRDVPIEDEAGCTALAENVQIDVIPPTKDDGRFYTVLIDGEDLTWEIRESNVAANVSPVSAYPGVRKALTEKQREIGMRGKVVMVGRDIGTVVMPDAKLKIYLDASVEERAKRRYDEILARGKEADYDEILTSMKKRDDIDSNRAVAPLRPADDAFLIDSDNLSIDKVFDKVMELAKESQLGNG